MHRKLGAFLFCLFLTSAAHSQGTILPDACGKDEVQFKVDHKVKYDEQGNPIVSPAPPQVGKAQVVFIENAGDWTTPTVRFGIDGAWAGADKGSSWFAVFVDPGIHHLCASWQSSLGRENRNVGMASFTAEAGKVYYFHVLINAANSDGSFVAPATGPGVTNGGGGFVRGRSDVSFAFSELSEDEGKYRIKASPHSTFTSEIRTQ